MSLSTLRGADVAKRRSIESEMRDDIVRGRIAPESWLRMEDLKARFDVGFSPIREALARLSAEGLVSLEPNRGFQVAALSREDLHDIAVVRCAIETSALRRSIERGGHDWEVGIIAAMHLYRRKSERAFESEDELQAWENAHEALHAALISACGSPRSLALQKRLQDQHLRYRRLIVIPQLSPEVHVEEHERLVALALERDVEKAVIAIQQHMMITVDALEKSQFWDGTTPTE
ncbi:MAG TPA: FCD domain-containing protein [Sphingomonas sp.]|jgi:DNA-binding GntR family transcriptional regulator